jgi:hypothetical protein
VLSLDPKRSDVNGDDHRFQPPANLTDFESNPERRTAWDMFEWSAAVAAIGDHFRIGRREDFLIDPQRQPIFRPFS